MKRMLFRLPCSERSEPLPGARIPVIDRPGCSASARRPRSALRKGGLDFGAHLLIFRRYRHPRQVARPFHLFDEIAAAAAHGEVQFHAEPLPWSEFTVDQTAGARCDFPAL
ncbi:hypothetical protein [Rhizobium sp. RU20A]|uniref:hypothetical protein n=1 Tax=Rhizobium sp. RU20A TaxID=1907412 RepID=UPI001FCECBEF|nr:hypothetical protein [Rhizobium sp. RU20A]